MQGCLLTKRYKKCICTYNDFVGTFCYSDDLKRAKYFKAKALYNVYIDKQMELHENFDIISPKDFSQKHEECYEEVKELLLILGDFVDDPDYKTDEEIEVMLDSSMMDYIHETNKLHEIQRCYLCRKKLVSERKKDHDHISIVAKLGDDIIPSVTSMYKDLTIKDATQDTLIKVTTKVDTQHSLKMDTSGPELQSASHSDGHSRKRGQLSSVVTEEESFAGSQIQSTQSVTYKRAKYSDEGSLLDYSPNISGEVIFHQDIHVERQVKGEASLSPGETKDSDVPSQCSKKRNAKPQKLIKSHLFPKAVLDRFAHAVPCSNDARVMVSHMPGLIMQRKYRNRLISPRRSTLFMLCSACENTLSGHGETQFVSQFFDKLYDTTHSSCMATSEQAIRYSQELYNFLIGMIFRTLYWTKGKYTNENELFHLLQQCRRYLLSLQSKSPPNPKDMPDVFIGISPLSVEKSELSHGFMNTVLSGTCLAINANNSLCSGEISPKTIVQSQYFLIHLGAINILVKLNASKDFELPKEFYVNPQGGVYHVPHESARKACLPKGLWHLFQLLAQMHEKQWLEASHNQYGTFESKGVDQPETSVADTYQITSGRDAELSELATIGLQPSPDPSVPKVINFLPDQYFVRPFQQQTIDLPPGHQVLIHETAGDAASGNTIFIAIKVDDDPLGVKKKPYVIWHYYNQGIQINFGFFIALDDNNMLKAEGFLANAHEKLRIEQFPEVIQIRNNASNVLPGVLQAKGFFTLLSLMNKVKVLRYKHALFMSLSYSKLFIERQDVLVHGPSSAV